MDVTKISVEDIAKMSEEERKEYVRSLVNTPNGIGINAAFYDAESGETYTFKNLIDKLGEEEAINVIAKALVSDKAEKRIITKEQFDCIRSKIKSGIELSEEEKIMHELIHETINESDMVQCQKNMMGTALTIIKFAQDTVGYNPYIADLIAAVNMITLSSLSLKEETQTYNYKGDFETLVDISTFIGNDILETWRQSCDTPVSPEMTVIGLCYAAMKVAAESHITFSKADDIFGMLGLTSEYLHENEDENGSNEGELSNDDMRNILKD